MTDEIGRLSLLRIIHLSSHHHVEKKKKIIHSILEPKQIKRK